MRKYRADYRSAKANTTGYNANPSPRRPPSEGSDAPERTRLLRESESILKLERDPWSRSVSRSERIDDNLRMHYHRSEGSQSSTQFEHASCPSDSFPAYPSSQPQSPQPSTTAPSTPSHGRLTRNVSFATLPLVPEATAALSATLPAAMMPLYPALVKKSDSAR